MNMEMRDITRAQYEMAEKRIEELLPLVSDATPTNDPLSVELAMMSDIVEEYEKIHYPIEKPTPAELIKEGLKEKNMTQKQLSEKIGISPSRVNAFVSGKSEPSLTLAGRICRILGIMPEAMLSY